MSEHRTLDGIYNEWRERGEAQLGQTAEAFFAPLLVQPPPDWTSAHTRIVYVGQETMGWLWTQANAEEYGYDEWILANVASLKDFVDNPQSLPALLEGYRWFNFASRQPLSHRSPFWRYFRDCKAAAEKQSSSVSMLFSRAG